MEVRTCSAERIAEELRKMLVHPSRSRGMQMFVDLGLAAAVLPEVLGLQKADLWEHVLTVLGLLEMPSVPLAFAALLHEQVGARLADHICLRLKMSNDERERIVWLVEKHQALCDARQLRPSKLKTLLNHAGIRDLLALHRADARASHKSEDHVDYCEQLLREWTQTDLNPEPLLTGYDLMQLGIPQGPLYKRLLDAVREAQLDGTICTQTEAIELVRRIQ
jgi:poly(A) polymerase